MSEEVIVQNTPASAAPQTPAAPSAPAPTGTRQGFGGGRRGGGGRERMSMRERGGRRGVREERVRPEFEQKTLNVRRVARVVAGGRRFNFSVLIVLGNKKGSVGVGTGKAADTAFAIEKATRNAKKEMIKMNLTKNHSIPHELSAKYSSARIILRPAKNRGLIAGSAVRAVLELGGITDVNAKILSSSKNKLNIARATIAALSALQAPKERKHEILNPKSETNLNDRKPDFKLETVLNL